MEQGILAESSLGFEGSEAGFCLVLSEYLGRGLVLGLHNLCILGEMCRHYKSIYHLLPQPSILQLSLQFDFCFDFCKVGRGIFEILLLGMPSTT